jgi:hypothetical protein
VKREAVFCGFCIERPPKPNEKYDVVDEAGGHRRLRQDELAELYRLKFKHADIWHGTVKA